jgi:hypothetical protein
MSQKPKVTVARLAPCIIGYLDLCKRLREMPPTGPNVCTTCALCELIIVVPHAAVRYCPACEIRLMEDFDLYCDETFE